MKAKKYVLKAVFDGIPKPTDFELIEYELEPLKDGEVLFASVCMAVDPFVRLTAKKIMSVGSTVWGGQISSVIETKNPAFHVGEKYLTYFGWTTHFIYNPMTWTSIFDPDYMKPFKLPDFGGLKLSWALGALGSSGLTALFGLTKIFRLEPGETLVVTAAAGSVGSIVGQIGKSLGLTVIGFTGTDEKVRLLKEELMYDYAFNYKTVNICEALKESAPRGVDCFFDNVGGRISHEIMLQMNRFGRVMVCGAISLYNDDGDSGDTILVPAFQKNVILKEIKIEGFLTSRWAKDRHEGTQRLIEMAKDGKLVIKETQVDGFENLPSEYIKLFTGDHVGRVVIKV